ncbi:carbonic anhydrase 2-like isoform X2 [Haematobia irritans]|uniref:carbonic anhydrase 2-like isoform X2 n=1 Tax=Haematobia irritans TaxID=7368 RepID=UPI003F4FB11B
MFSSTFICSFIVMLLILRATSSTPSPSWSYDDTNWGVDYPQCNGNYQSPIHIQTGMSFYLPMPRLKFYNYDVPLSGPVTLVNNGHSVDLIISSTINGERPYISGGTLLDKYEAVGVHFHWGSSRSKGSEHVINNRRFDAEMHIVHKSIRYQTVEEATQYSDGLAVLGIMIKGSQYVDRYYPGLNKVFNKLADVIDADSETTIQGQISLGQLMGDLRTNNFYTYKGSLTTPGCSEAVTWHVFPEPLAISRSHLRKFFSILDSHDEPMLNNYRPLQNLNGRSVFYRIGIK